MICFHGIRVRFAFRNLISAKVIPQPLIGVEAAHTIRARYPKIGVVVLSQHADEAYAFELLKHGAAGLAYLLKERVGDLDELLRALR
jgi:DNA-binding NarL/FixJ family response regulator